MKRCILYLMLPVLLMGCLPEEVSFSSTTGTAGQTVTVSGRVRVYNPNISAVQNDFWVDWPMSVTGCVKGANVGTLSALQQNNEGGLWRAVMFADDVDGMWAKGPHTLYSCTVLIPVGTAPGDYYIHTSTGPMPPSATPKPDTGCSGSNTRGNPTGCVEKAGGKIHVNA